MDSQQELVALMREQNELLKRYLWRLRFSLLGLLLLMTGIAIGLGVIGYQQRSPSIVPTATMYSGPTPLSAPGMRIVTEQRVLSNGQTIIEKSMVPDNLITGAK